MTIREWVTQRFSTPEPKLFLELGAHIGEDTRWMAEIPGVTIHAWEADPRNYDALLDWVGVWNRPPNIWVYPQAVGDQIGENVPFYPSLKGWGRTQWTYSGSMLPPKAHLNRYPTVTFGRPVSVGVTTLDYETNQMVTGRRIPQLLVDFIWCDIQGSEAAMIRGGFETLKQTRYLYMEYSNEELYEGQEPLAELMRMLPGWYPIQLWRDDEMNGNVLLQNLVLQRQLESTQPHLNREAVVCA